MGKVAKPKKRDISLHSRAARRGASPNPGVPVKAAAEETDYKPWLHNAQDAGVAKKKKVKQLSRQQKARQQKGMEKAERDMDKLEKKVADSKTRGRAVDARRAAWEDLNDSLSGQKVTSASKFKALDSAAEDGMEEDDDQADIDDDDGGEALQQSDAIDHAGRVQTETALGGDATHDVDEVL